MKYFYLKRNEDESGVSGTGIVAQGCIFQNGKVAMTWIKEETSVDATSVAVYDSIEDVKEIHGHDGKTKVMIEDNLSSMSYELDEWKKIKKDRENSSFLDKDKKQ